MSHQVLSVRTYVVVLLLLLALTVLTVGCSFIQTLAGPWHIAVGLGIACVKASLVMLFFMHVITSPRLTWVIIAVALLWLLILVSLTLCDYLTRGLTPFSGQ